MVRPGALSSGARAAHTWSGVGEGGTGCATATPPTWGSVCTAPQLSGCAEGHGFCTDSASVLARTAGMRYRETSQATTLSLRGNGCGPGFEAANFESKPERGPLVGPLFMFGPISARQLCICHICPQALSSKDEGALGVRSPAAAPYRVLAHRWSGQSGGSTRRSRTRRGRSSDRACRRARRAHRRGSGPWRCPASRHGF